MVMLPADSNLQPHTDVLPVAKVLIVFFSFQYLSSSCLCLLVAVQLLVTIGAYPVSYYIPSTSSHVSTRRPSAVYSTILNVLKDKYLHDADASPHYNQNQPTREERRHYVALTQPQDDIIFLDSASSFDSPTGRDSSSYNGNHEHVLYNHRPVSGAALTRDGINDVDKRGSQLSVDLSLNALGNMMRLQKGRQHQTDRVSNSQSVLFRVG